MSKVLITGGLGFVASHMIEHLLVNTDFEIITIDSFSYAGNANRLSTMRDFNPKRVKVLYHNLRAPLDPIKGQIGEVDYIIHAAAQSHVENSLDDPISTIESNVMGTAHMLEFARGQKNLKRFFYVSTDEVYGPAEKGHDHLEGSVHRPSNPYSASKAAAENLCYCWARSMEVPILVSNTMNNFGERQHPEKFIPMTIKKLLNDEVNIIHAQPNDHVMVQDSYGRGVWEPGSRYWLHARNHADAILFLINKEKSLPVYDQYNVVGELEVDNYQMVRLIGEILGIEPKTQFVDFHSSRPGHDMRYGLVGDKIAKLGWEISVPFKESLERTVKWTLDHREWLVG